MRLRRGKYFSVNRDDNEACVIVCPACLQNDIEDTNRKVDGRTDHKMQKLPVYKCNSCDAEFALYPEDGIRELENSDNYKELLNGKPKKDLPIDLQDDGQDSHGHAPYVMVNRNKAHKKMVARRGSFPGTSPLRLQPDYGVEDEEIDDEQE